MSSLMSSLMSLRLAFLSLLALVVSACGQSNGSEKKGGHPGMGMPPPEVNVMTVAPRTLTLVFEYAGQTAGSREVEVRARVAGIMLKRNFVEGAPVKQGQSLYSIDPAPFEAALARAEADVAAAEARYEQAKRNAARLKPLYAEKAVSQKEYDDAVSAESIGAADLKAARARAVEARLNVALHQGRGAGVGRGEPLAALGRLARRRARQTLLTTRDPGRSDLGELRHHRTTSRRSLQREVAGRARRAAEGRRLRGRAEAAPTARSTTHSGKLNFTDVRVSANTGTRESRAEMPESRRRAAARRVRARDPARRDAPECAHRCRSARCSRARRASSSTWSTRKARRSRGRSRSATGRATTGSSPRACSRAIG